MKSPNLKTTKGFNSIMKIHKNFFLNLMNQILYKELKHYLQAQPKASRTSNIQINHINNNNNNNNNYYYNKNNNNNNNINQINYLLLYPPNNFPCNNTNKYINQSNKFNFNKI